MCKLTVSGSNNDPDYGMLCTYSVGFWDTRKEMREVLTSCLSSKASSYFVILERT